MAIKKLVSRTETPVYKAGQYFKGTACDARIIGRITTTQEGLAVVFHDVSGDIGRWNTKYDVVERYDFNADEEINNIENIEIITKAQYEKLAKHPLYVGFMDYSILITKGKTPAQDKFEFGCGAISVTRAEIEQLLAVFKIIPPSQLNKITSLLHKIDDETEKEIQDSDVPLIKQILEA